MYEAKGMEMTSAALELKPWWVGKSKEAVEHLENLRLSPLETSRAILNKIRGIPNVAFLFILLCFTRFPCPDHTVMKTHAPLI